MIKPKTHHVYLLAVPRSYASTKRGPRTYIGYTVAPKRRLRQHNREIKGGARSTGGRAGCWYRPVFVSGFVSDTRGLHFEHVWKKSRDAISDWTIARASCTDEIRHFWGLRPPFWQRVHLLFSILSDGRQPHPKRVKKRGRKSRNPIAPLRACLMREHVEGENHLTVSLAANLRPLWDAFYSKWIYVVPFTVEWLIDEGKT